MQTAALQKFTSGSTGAVEKLNAMIDHINANKPIAGKGISIQETETGTQINLNLPAVDGGSDGISGTIEKPKAKTYNIDVSARASYSVRQIAIKLSAGTCTVAVKKNGASIGNMGSIAVTTSLQVVTASGDNTLEIGDTLALTVSSPSSAADLDFSIGM